jgi:glucose uptake protein GlcU
LPGDRRPATGDWRLGSGSASGGTLRDGTLIGLLERREWARILTIILGVLHLLGFPIGTALGVYTLYVLLNDQTKPLFA